MLINNTIYLIYIVISCPVRIMLGKNTILVVNIMGRKILHLFFKMDSKQSKNIHSICFNDKIECGVVFKKQKNEIIYLHNK